MEKSERDKKLEAGKQKLVAFQKKRRKKKPSKDSDFPTGLLTDCSSDSFSVSDSDGHSMTSGDESLNEDERIPTRDLVTAFTQLRRANDKISQLEEVILGKQGALIGVTEENNRLTGELRALTEQIQENRTMEDSGPHEIGGGDSPDMVAIIDCATETELLSLQVYTLQQHLSQSVKTIRSHVEQHQISSQALHEAKHTMLKLRRRIDDKEEQIMQLRRTAQPLSCSAQTLDGHNADVLHLFSDGVDSREIPGYISLPAHRKEMEIIRIELERLNLVKDDDGLLAREENVQLRRKLVTLAQENRELTENLSIVRSQVDDLSRVELDEKARNDILEQERATGELSNAEQLTDTSYENTVAALKSEIERFEAVLVERNDRIDNVNSENSRLNSIIDDLTSVKVETLSVLNSVAQTESLAVEQFDRLHSVNEPSNENAATAAELLDGLHSVGEPSNEDVNAQDSSVYDKLCDLINSLPRCDQFHGRSVHDAIEHLMLYLDRASDHEPIADNEEERMQKSCSERNESTENDLSNAHLSLDVNSESLFDTSLPNSCDESESRHHSVAGETTNTIAEVTDSFDYKARVKICHVEAENSRLKDENGVLSHERDELIADVERAKLKDGEFELVKSQVMSLETQNDGLVVAVTNQDSEKVQLETSILAFDTTKCDLLQQIGDLTDKLNVVTENNYALENENRNLELTCSELDAVKMKLTEVCLQNTELSDDLSSTEKQRDQCQQELNDLTRHNNGLNDAMSIHTKERDVLITDLQLKVSSIEHLTLNNLLLKSEKGEVRSELEVLQEEMLVMKNDLDGYASIVDHRLVESMEQEVMLYRDKNYELQTVVERVTEQITVLEAEKNELKDASNDLETGKSMLKNERDELEAENISLNHENDKLEAENIGLRHEKDTLDDENSCLKNEKEVLVAERIGLKNEKDQLEAETNLLKSQKIVIGVKLEADIKDMKMIEAHNVVLQENLEKNCGDASKFETQLSHYKTSNTDLAKQVEQLRSKNRQVLEGLEKAERDYDSLMLDYKDQKILFQDLNEGNDALIEQVERYEQDCKCKESEIEELKLKVDECGDVIVKLRRNTDDLVIKYDNLENDLLALEMVKEDNESLLSKCCSLEATIIDINQQLQDKEIAYTSKFGIAESSLETSHEYQNELIDKCTSLELKLADSTIQLESIDGIRKKYSFLEEKLAKTQNMLRVSESKCDGLEAELGVCNLRIQQLCALDNKCSSFQTELDTTLLKLETVTVSNGLLQEKCERLENTLVESQRKTENLVSISENLEVELIEGNKLLEVKEELLTRHVSLEADLASSLQSNRELVEKCSTLEGDLVSTSENLQDTILRCEGLDTELEITKMEQIEEVEVFKTNSVKLNEELEISCHQLKETQAEFDEIEGKLAAQKEACSSLEAVEKELEEANYYIMTENKELTECLMELKIKVNNNEEVISLLSEEKTDLVKDMSEKMEETNAEILHHINRLAKYEDKLMSISEEKEFLQSKFDKLSEEGSLKYETVLKEKDDVDVVLAECRVNLMQCQEELRRFNESKEELVFRSNSLEENVTKLETEKINMLENILMKDEATNKTEKKIIDVLEQKLQIENELLELKEFTKTHEKMENKLKIKFDETIGENEELGLELASLRENVELIMMEKQEAILKSDKLQKETDIEWKTKFDEVTSEKNGRDLEIACLIEKLELLTKENEQCVNKITNLEAQLNEYKHRLESKEALLTRHVSLEADLASSLQSNRDLVEKCSTLEGDLVSISENLQDTILRCEGLDKELEITKMEQIEEVEVFKTNRVKLNEELEISCQQLKETQAEFDEIKGKLAAQKEACSSLEAVKKELEEANYYIVTENSELTERLLELKIKVNNNEEVISLLSEEKIDLEKDMSEKMEERNAEILHDINRLAKYEDKLMSISEEKEFLQSKFDTLSEEGSLKYETVLKEKDDVDVVLAECRVNLMQCHEELRRFNESKEELVFRSNSLEENVTKLETEKTNMLENILMKDEVIRKFEQDLKDVSKQKMLIKNELQELIKITKNHVKKESEQTIQFDKVVKEKEELSRNVTGLREDIKLITAEKQEAIYKSEKLQTKDFEWKNELNEIKFEKDTRDFEIVGLNDKLELLTRENQRLVGKVEDLEDDGKRSESEWNIKLDEIIEKNGDLSDNINVLTKKLEVIMSEKERLTAEAEEYDEKIVRLSKTLEETTELYECRIKSLIGVVNEKEIQAKESGKDDVKIGLHVTSSVDEYSANVDSLTMNQVPILGGIDDVLKNANDGDHIKSVKMAIQNDVSGQDLNSEHAKKSRIVDDLEKKIREFKMQETPDLNQHLENNSYKFEEELAQRDSEIEKLKEYIEVKFRSSMEYMNEMDYECKLKMVEDDYKIELESLEKEVVRLTLLLNEVRPQTDQFMEQIENMTSLNDGLTADIVAFETQVSEKNSEIQSLYSKIENMKTAMEALYNQTRKLSEEMDALKTSLMSEVDNVMSEKEKLVILLQEKENDETVYLGKLKDLDCLVIENKHLLEKVQENAFDREKMTEEMSILIADKHSLVGSLSIKSRALTESFIDHDLLHGNVNSLTETLELSESEIHNLQESLETVETSNSDLRENVIELERIGDGQKEQLELYIAETSTLKDKLFKSSNEMENSKQDSDYWKAEHQALVLKLSELENNHKNEIANNTNDFQLTIKKLQDDTNDLNKTNMELEGKIRSTEDRNSELDFCYRAVVDENNVLNEEAKVLNELRTEIDVQLKDAERLCTELTYNFDTVKARNLELKEMLDKNEAERIEIESKCLEQVEEIEKLKVYKTAVMPGLERISDCDGSGFQSDVSSLLDEVFALLQESEEMKDLSSWCTSKRQSDWDAGDVEVVLSESILKDTSFDSSVIEERQKSPDELMLELRELKQNVYMLQRDFLDIGKNIVKINSELDQREKDGAAEIGPSFEQRLSDIDKKKESFTRQAMGVQNKLIHLRDTAYNDLVKSGEDRLGEVQEKLTSESSDLSMNLMSYEISGDIGEIRKEIEAKYLEKLEYHKENMEDKKDMELQQMQIEMMIKLENEIENVERELHEKYTQQFNALVSEQEVKFIRELQKVKNELSNLYNNKMAAYGVHESPLPIDEEELMKQTRTISPQVESFDSIRKKLHDSNVHGFFQKSDSSDSSSSDDVLCLPTQFSGFQPEPDPAIDRTKSPPQDSFVADFTETDGERNAVKDSFVQEMFSYSVATQTYPSEAKESEGMFVKDSHSLENVRLENKWLKTKLDEQLKLFSLEKSEFQKRYSEVKIELENVRLSHSNLEDEITQCVGTIDSRNLPSVDSQTHDALEFNVEREIQSMRDEVASKKNLRDLDQPFSISLIQEDRQRQTVPNDYSSEEKFVVEKNFKEKSTVALETGGKSIIRLSRNPGIRNGMADHEVDKSSLLLLDETTRILDSENTQLAELTKLRREIHETRVLYARENAFLQETLDRDTSTGENSHRMSLQSSPQAFNDIQLSLSSQKSVTSAAEDTASVSGLQAHMVDLKNKLKVLEKSNLDLSEENLTWSKLLHQQENLVKHVNRSLEENDGDSQNAFGKQIGLLQSQRDELQRKLKDKTTQESALIRVLGDKAVLEDDLRREKSILADKIFRKGILDVDYVKVKTDLERSIQESQRLEEKLRLKDESERELMRQKRLLEEGLSEIECRLQEREAQLEYEKTELTKELNDKSILLKQIECSRFGSTESLASASMSIGSVSITSQEDSDGKLRTLRRSMDKRHKQAIEVLRMQLEAEHMARELRIREQHQRDVAQLKTLQKQQVGNAKLEYAERLLMLAKDLRPEVTGGTTMADLSTSHIAPYNNQQLWEEMKSVIEPDIQERLDTLLADINDHYQCELQRIQHSHREEVHLHVEAMRVSVEQIHTAEFEVLQAECERQYLSSTAATQERLNDDYKRKVTSLEASYDQLNIYSSHDDTHGGSGVEQHVRRECSDLEEDDDLVNIDSLDLSELRDLYFAHRFEIGRLRADVSAYKSKIAALKSDLKSDQLQIERVRGKADVPSGERVDADTHNKLRDLNDEFDDKIRTLTLEFDERCEKLRLEYDEREEEERSRLDEEYRSEMTELRKELSHAKERFAQLVEALDNGDFGSPALSSYKDSLREKMDLELEMARTLLQQEYDDHNINLEEYSQDEVAALKLKLQEELCREHDSKMEHMRVAIEQEQREKVDELTQKYQRDLDHVRQQSEDNKSVVSEAESLQTAEDTDDLNSMTNLDLESARDLGVDLGNTLEFDATQSFTQLASLSIRTEYEDSEDGSDGENDALVAYASMHLGQQESGAEDGYEGRPTVTSLQDEPALSTEIVGLKADTSIMELTNRHLLQVLSDSAKTYLNIEDSISQCVNKLAARENSMTAADLDISRKITSADCLFEGPDLDEEGEELVKDIGSRLQTSVSHLIEMIEATSSQLHQVRQTQGELLDTMVTRSHDSDELTSELDDRLRELMSTKEYLALELHKAEGLVEGYVSEQTRQWARVAELEDREQCLILDLDRTKCHLRELETSQAEVEALKAELHQQKQLLAQTATMETRETIDQSMVTEPINDDGLLLEINRLNDEKRELHHRLQRDQDVAQNQLRQAEMLVEELQHFNDVLSEDKRLETGEFCQQIEVLEKQLRTNRQFLDEQAIDRERERDEADREISRLKETISQKEKRVNADGQLKQEVEELNEALQIREVKHRESLTQNEVLHTQLGVTQDTVRELRQRVRGLEMDIEEKGKKLSELVQKLASATAELQKSREMEEVPESDRSTLPGLREVIEDLKDQVEAKGHQLHQGQIAMETEMKRARDCEDELMRDKEALQERVYDLLNQASSLKVQLDQHKHRSIADLDEHTRTLKDEVDSANEEAYSKHQQVMTLEEQMTQLQSDLNEKEEIQQQVTLQLQLANQQLSYLQREQSDSLKDIMAQNDHLEDEVRRLSDVVETPSVPLSLLQEKNAQIDELTEKLESMEDIETLRCEMADQTASLALKEAEIEELKSKLDTFGSQESFIDTTGSESMKVPLVFSTPDKVSLQDEMEEAVTLEHLEQRRDDLHAENIELQTTNSELSVTITDLREELSTKDTVVEDITAQTETLQREIENLTQFQNKLQEDFDTVQRMCEEKQKEIERLNGERTDSDVRELQRYENEIEELKYALASKGMTIDEKEEELYFMQEKMETLEGANRELKSYRNAMAEKEMLVAELTQNVETNRELMDKQTDEVAVFKREVVRLKVQLEDKAKQMQTQKVEQSRLEAIVDERESHIKTLREDKKLCETSETHARRELQAVKETLDDRERHIRKLTRAMAEQHSNEQDRDIQMKILQSELMEAKVGLLTSQQEVSGSKAEIDKLRVQLQDLLLQKDSQICSLEAETANLRNQLSDRERVDAEEVVVREGRLSVEKELRKTLAVVEEMRQNSVSLDELQRRIGELRDQLTSEHEGDLRYFQERSTKVVEDRLTEQFEENAKLVERLKADHQQEVDRLREEYKETAKVVGNGTMARTSMTASSLDFTLTDDVLSEHLRSIVERLHKSGVQALSFSQLKFLEEHVSPQRPVSPQRQGDSVDIVSLQSLWEAERQAYKAATQTLRDLGMVVEKVASGNEEGEEGASDWRSDVIQAVSEAFTADRDIVISQLHTQAVFSGEGERLHTLEALVRQQGIDHQKCLERLLLADRQSLLSEVRQLRSRLARTQILRDEEKTRASRRLGDVEIQGAKQERQLKRKVELFESKLNQETIVSDDLKCSLDIEKARSRDLSGELTKERNHVYDVQAELSARDTQLNKLRELVHREQEKYKVTIESLEEERARSHQYSEALDELKAENAQVREALEEEHAHTTQVNSKHRQLLQTLQRDMEKEQTHSRTLAKNLAHEHLCVENLRKTTHSEQESHHAVEEQMRQKLAELEADIERERAQSSELQSGLCHERGISDQLYRSLEQREQQMNHESQTQITNLLTLHEAEKQGAKELERQLTLERGRMATAQRGAETDKAANEWKLVAEKRACEASRGEVAGLQMQNLELVHQSEVSKHRASKLEIDNDQLHLELDSLRAVVRNAENQREHQRAESKQKVRDLKLMCDDGNFKLLGKDVEIQQLKQKLEDAETKMQKLEEWSKESQGREMQAMAVALTHSKAKVRQLEGQLKVAHDTHERLSRQADLSPADNDQHKIERLYGRYLRAESFRKSLIYQKKYLLLLLGGFRDGERETLAVIATMGCHPAADAVLQYRARSPMLLKFRTGVQCVIAIHRMKYLSRKWQRAVDIGVPVMTSNVMLTRGYLATSATLAPPRPHATHRPQHDLVRPLHSPTQHRHEMGAACRDTAITNRHTYRHPSSSLRTNDIDVRHAFLSPATLDLTTTNHTDRESPMDAPQLTGSSDPSIPATLPASRGAYDLYTSNARRSASHTDAQYPPSSVQHSTYRPLYSVPASRLSPSLNHDWVPLDRRSSDSSCSEPRQYHLSSSSSVCSDTRPTEYQSTVTSRFTGSRGRDSVVARAAHSDTSTRESSEFIYGTPPERDAPRRVVSDIDALRRVGADLSDKTPARRSLLTRPHTTTHQGHRADTLQGRGDTNESDMITTPQHNDYLTKLHNLQTKLEGLSARRDFPDPVRR